MSSRTVLGITNFVPREDGEDNDKSLGIPAVFTHRYTFITAFTLDVDANWIEQLDKKLEDTRGLHQGQKTSG